jgi:DMSO/TMAO reductase YedYZ molybdopterin-dependent catalytic subunit
MMIDQREGKMECNRRAFLRNMGMGTLGLGFGVSVFSQIYQCGEALAQTNGHDLYMRGTINFKGFIAEETTPNNEFYITSYSKDVPEVNPDTFSLRIEGLVEKPLALGLKELEGMQDKHEYVTLECIGNPVGGNAIGNALWEGVTLKKVLEKANPKPGIVKAAFFAAEGYSDSIPYALALSEEVFLAFHMNGEPLPHVHGYPLRVIVPGIFGMKNVKWLTKIELVNYDFKGYWEKKGWSDEAVIPLMSEVLMPMDGKRIPLGHYVIGGIAFGGRHGISRVQVDVDGQNWQEAELKPALSKWAWILWRYDWSPTREGDFSIRVRAYDRSGKVQESPSLLGSVLGTYPDGAKGIHTIHVQTGKT